MVPVAGGGSIRSGRHAGLDVFRPRPGMARQGSGNCLWIARIPSRGIHGTSCYPWPKWCYVMPITTGPLSPRRALRSRAPPLAMPPSATGALARLAVARAAASGIAVRPLLCRAGLSERQIKNPHARIGAANQAELVGLLAEALGDDLFGFHLGQSFELGEIGLLYYVMASAPTLCDALARAAHYGAITNEGIAPVCGQGDEVRVLVSYVGLARHAARHQVEFWMTGLVRAARQLTGLRLSPVHFALCHPRHAGAREIEAFLGCAVAFDAPADEFGSPLAAGTRLWATPTPTCTISCSATARRRSPIAPARPRACARGWRTR